MDTGRELDAAVARMMGWRDLHWQEVRVHAPTSTTSEMYGVSPAGWYGVGPHGATYMSRHYSTDDGDAWQVVDHVLAEHPGTIVSVESFNTEQGRRWDCVFITDDANASWRASDAETRAEAICRAALKVAEEKESESE